ncbi:hypothetical protein F66182_5044 [Fusarium sp. NRRL 66182]|nr:hypothetical protein F66182_5044 [Fusarium sp. NRRL 66182]
MESSMSASSRSSDSGASSVSEYTPAPLDGRPHNFGVVFPGVYRSSFPKSHDFEYIKGLGLKTIVTLVRKEEFDHDLETFVARQGIRQAIFDMKGTKKEAIPLSTMKAILSIVLDQSNYPLLIHCNHGKHRTGCVVGVARKVAGWNVENVVAEYKSYAEPKSRDCDVGYLEDFQVSSLVISNTPKPKDHCARCSRVHAGTFFRAVVFSTGVLLVWLLSGSRLCIDAGPSHPLL